MLESGHGEKQNLAQKQLVIDAVADKRVGLFSSERLDQQWFACVNAQFDTFLIDHAACEKKASGMALSMAAHYPDKPELLTAMVDLAVEELSHYQQVMHLLVKRGVQPGKDERDAYVNELNAQVLRGRDAYLLDRLLLAAVIEARGQQRFGVIAAGVEDAGLQRFYRSITRSEARHSELFVNLAAGFFPREQIDLRLAQWIEIEAEVIQRIPIRPALH